MDLTTQKVNISEILVWAGRYLLTDLLLLSIYKSSVNFIEILNPYEKL